MVTNLSSRWTGRAQRVRSHHDAVYSLNVLLGLSRIQAIPQYIDVSEVFQINVDQLTHLFVPKHAFAMALWVAARLKLDVPFGASKIVRQLLEDRSNRTDFKAQDLGMLLSRIVAQAAVGKAELVHHVACYSYGEFDDDSRCH